jgi:Phage related hypothetical protein (DUF1799)
MMGISLEDFLAMLPVPDSKPQDEDFEIWQDNLPALEIFLACHKQWRILTGGDKPWYQGLRYLEVEAVMRIRRIKNQAAVFADVQVMEEAAMTALNER